MKMLTSRQLIQISYKISFLLLLSLSLSGCFGMRFQSEHYSGIKESEVTTKKGTFILQDNVAERKIYLRPDMGMAFSVGTPPLPWVREAAAALFIKTGRDCKVKDAYLVQDPFYEILYTCK